jgi:hypothetical protein
VAFLATVAKSARHKGVPVDQSSTCQVLAVRCPDDARRWCM